MYIPIEDIVVPIVFGVPGVVLMTKMWFSHKEKMAALRGPRQGLGITDARFERLEQAVESIAIEMERVSEGQRFVTKLLSERAPEAPGQLPAGQARRTPG
jgi:3-hydroxymyristoyl/3-hydroxydecanoyl-(acyl carrier protein) dehydratase